MEKWLSNEPKKALDIIQLSMEVMVLSKFASIFAFLLMVALGLIIPDTISAENIERIRHAPYLLVLAAFKEEVVFRLPLALTNGESLKVRMIVAAALSIFFGYAHGSMLNVPIQGVAGMIYSLAFLKLGGMNGRIIKPLIAMTAIHAAGNFLLLLKHLLSS